MDAEQNESNREGMIGALLNIIAYGISPILFIWAVNTLFNCGIPMSFKTWLAGLVLIMLVRFHVKAPATSHAPYDFYDEEEYSDEDYDEAESESEAEADKEEKTKSNLIPYQGHKNKKNLPPDGS